MRVAILDDYHQAYEATQGLQRLRARAEVKIFTSPIRDVDILKGFDAIVANRERTRFTQQLLSSLPDLRVIAQTGNHVHHIDLRAAEQRGIVVAKATGGGSISTAELTFGLMIALMRRIPTFDAEIRRNNWPMPMTPVLRGKTLGIVGLGYVGRHVAKIANAFEMHVQAWGPRLTADAASTVGANARPLDDMLAESDVVSVHATLSEDSRGLIDGRRLSLMKPNAYLINTARAAIVDELALCAALRDNRIAGAALDVFWQEPLPPDHPITRLPNTILTPHLGWPTDEMYARFADAAADALIAYLDGQDVPRFVSHQ